MPQNMSFSMTIEQFRSRTKDVTRRLGWWSLQPGDIVCGVEKRMGLKRGEKIKRLGLIEIVSTHIEPLNAITVGDVAREGFPDWTTEQFVQMLVDHYRIAADASCNRIEFKYLDSDHDEKP